MEFLVWVKYFFFPLQLFLLKVNSGFEWFFIKVQLSCRDVVSAPVTFVWLWLIRAESHFSMRTVRDPVISAEAKPFMKSVQPGKTAGQGWIMANTVKGHFLGSLCFVTSSEFIPYSSLQTAMLSLRNQLLKWNSAKWKVPKEALCALWWRTCGGDGLLIRVSLLRSRVRNC